MHVKTDSLGRHEILDGDSEAGFSLNPFKAVRRLTGGISHLARGTITSVSSFYAKVTPSDLKKILRWTPSGLVLRAGIKIAPKTLKILGAVVKWSPHGMVYRGTEHVVDKYVK